MKQLLSLFLFLLPCLAWAQYPSNGNQKITLGEQTTADGLIWRGVLADTGIITPSSDTSAYIILDTVNHRFYNYNRATNVWSVAGGGTSVTTFSAGTTGLTPSTATSGAVTLGGTLAVANGGTGTTSFSPNNYLIRTNSSGNFDTSLVYEAGGKVGIGIASPTEKLHVVGNGLFTGTIYSGDINTNADNKGIYFNGSRNAILGNNTNETISFATANVSRLTISSTGLATFTNNINSGDIITNGNNKGIYFNGTRNAILGNTSPEEIRFATANVNQLVIGPTGAVTISNLAGGTSNRAVLADVNGALSAPVSSINYKENVQNLNYGLKEILQISPVSFNFINKNKWGDGLDFGFIVEDMFPVIPEVTGTINDGTMYLDMTKLIPILTKAIQEQQALIKALEQRIINLENK